MSDTSLFKLDLIDFFNPYDAQHLKAYRYLEDHGTWPPGFIPSNVETHAHWHVFIGAKMAQAWMKHVLDDSTDKTLHKPYMIPIKTGGVTGESIQGFGYDKKLSSLYVDYRNGSYVYKDVPRDLWEGLLEAENKREYFSTAIRTKFQCEKL